MMMMRILNWTLWFQVQFLYHHLVPFGGAGLLSWLVERVSKYREALSWKIAWLIRDGNVYSVSNSIPNLFLTDGC